MLICWTGVNVPRVYARPQECSVHQRKSAFLTKARTIYFKEKERRIRVFGEFKVKSNTAAANKVNKLVGNTMLTEEVLN